VQPNLLVNLSKSSLPGPSNISAVAKNKRQQRTDEIVEAANKKAKISAVGAEVESAVAGARQIVQNNTQADRKLKPLTKAQEMSRANTIIPPRK